MDNSHFWNELKCLQNDINELWLVYKFDIGILVPKSHYIFSSNIFNSFYCNIKKKQLIYKDQVYLFKIPKHSFYKLFLQ